MSGGVARRAWPFGTLLAATLSTALFVASAAFGQAPDAPTDHRRGEEMLRSLEQGARASGERQERLEREIGRLRAEQGRLSSALVAAGHAARLAEERVDTGETRLASLVADETALRRSLQSRRSALTELLASLQRLGLHPPPALLVPADDVVAALRSALLLGSLAPALREEATRLAADLQRLARLKAAIAADQAALEADYRALAAERDRIGALLRGRQSELASAEGDAGRERGRAESLGREARGVRDLIDRAEAEAERARARAAAEDAARQEAARQEGRAVQERFAAASLREPPRLGPRQAFAESRGSLIRPVAGVVLREFGAPDGAGGTMRGLAIRSRPRAFVTAPGDGTVVFAGPFRSYGRLVILNAGGGYYVLLAGMDAIEVAVGQFVLSGEPIARMGEIAAPSAALGVVEAGGPVLYIEFRKDGGPIDPGPFWAKSQSERARG